MFGIWNRWEDFQRIILHAIYPLHPISTYLLCNLTDWLQSRSSLTLLSEKVREISDTELDSEKELPLIYPVTLLKGPFFSELLSAEEQGRQRISVNGERYTIKSTTVNTTGAFYGLEPPESSTPDRQIFEYVVVVRFSKNMELEDIYEIDWPTFIKHKHWHSRIRAWNLILSKALIEDSKIVFHNDKAQNE